LFSSIAQAEWEDIDFSQVPAWCVDRMKNIKTAKGQRQAQLMGAGCYTFGNHYCYALAQVQRYFKSLGGGGRGDVGQLNMAVNNFAYLEAHAGSSCIIQPEVWVNQGKTLLLLNQPSQAAKLFEKAARKNPKFVPAYISLADLYKKAGQKDVAQKILEHGVAINPTNVALQRRLAELGRGAGKAGMASKPGEQ
jgi:tetratricopeptide (TPR) repeat protein